MIDPSVGEVMALVSPPVGAVLAALDEMPRTPEWLTRNLHADPMRMARLARDAGLVEGELGWFGRLKLWRLTDKGEAYHRIWLDEMDRRRRAASKGPFLDRELDQIPDNATFRTFESSATGMSSTLIQVPHDPVARDEPWEPPEDMVVTLGLLDEGDGASVNYLVGANTAAEGTTAQRMEQILPMLQGMGLAVQKGHGWARTIRGTRMHELWIIPKEGAPT